MRYVRRISLTRLDFDCCELLLYLGNNYCSNSKRKTDEMKMKALLGLLSCCIHLATGFVSAGGITPTIRSAAASTTELQGGYENGLVGVNPTTPLRFFTLPGNTCPYAQRTHITLIELGLPFDMSEVLMDLGVKPDWYLKVS